MLVRKEGGADKGNAKVNCNYGSQKGRDKHTISVPALQECIKCGDFEGDWRAIGSFKTEFWNKEAKKRK